MKRMFWFDSLHMSVGENVGNISDLKAKILNVAKEKLNKQEFRNLSENLEFENSENKLNKLLKFYEGGV